MRSLKPQLILMIILLAPLGASPACSAAVLRLEVAASRNFVVAGFNESLWIKVSNNYEDLYDLTITLSVPSPLVVIGPNNWKMESLRKGSSESLPITIYAPSGSVGNTYSCSLTISYKRLGYVSYYTETYSFNLFVRGWIKMVVYGLSLDPRPAFPGARLALAGTVLNQGNTAAMYANVSVIPRQPFEPLDESTSYLGQIDPNSPAPFTLYVRVRERAQNGTYPLTIILTYLDDLSERHSISIPVEVPISQAPQARGGASSGPLSPQWNFALAVSIFVAVAIAILYVRRKRGARRSP
ncbi:MAG: hypothetical protein QXL35_00470 [Candidatus Bathyarchaeia archaeon]